MRWSVIEKQVRKALVAEFQLKTDQAFDLIEETRQKHIQEAKTLLDEIKAKKAEAEAMQEKNIESGRIDAKQKILSTMAFVINSHYNSAQTKTKLQAFVNKVQEQLQF